MVGFRRTKDFGLSLGKWSFFYSYMKPEPEYSKSFRKTIERVKPKQRFVHRHARYQADDRNRDRVTQARRRGICGGSPRTSWQ
jgi:hypothetical protein